MFELVRHDVSRPHDSGRVEADRASGLSERWSFRNPSAAVFLDRDGTLNVEANRVSSADELELIPGAGEAVRRLNRAGLLAVVVTNQSVIARGDCTEGGLKQIHDKLEALLREQGAYLDAIYHCPHHPDGGLRRARAKLNVECDCRKPGTAMIERAKLDLSIRLGSSWMIGDTTTDLQTAHNAGIRSILVRTGYGGRDRRWRARPDFEFFDVNEAAEFVTNRHARLLEQARTLLPSCASGSLLAIGGLARSGKSTWASIFSEVLAERGQRGRVLPLDSWLLSIGDRGPGHVMQRFDVDAIANLAKNLSARTERLEVSLGHYDRFTRERDTNGSSIMIEPEDVVLFDGVPALAIDALVTASSSTFYVECSEIVRRERFNREYESRGLFDPEIELLYRERDVDEHPLVLKSAAVADIRIASGS